MGFFFYFTFRRAIFLNYFLNIYKDIITYEVVSNLVVSGVYYSTNNPTSMSFSLHQSLQVPFHHPQSFSNFVRGPMMSVELRFAWDEKVASRSFSSTFFMVSFKSLKPNLIFFPIVCFHVW